MTGSEQRAEAGLRDTRTIVIAGGVVLALAFGVRAVFGGVVQPLSDELFGGRIEVFSCPSPSRTWCGAGPARFRHPRRSLRRPPRSVAGLRLLPGRHADLRVRQQRLGPASGRRGAGGHGHFRHRLWPGAGGGGPGGPGAQAGPLPGHHLGHGLRRPGGAAAADRLADRMAGLAHDPAGDHRHPGSHGPVHSAPAGGGAGARHRRRGAAAAARPGARRLRIPGLPAAQRRFLRVRFPPGVHHRPPAHLCAELLRVRRFAGGTARPGAAGPGTGRAGQYFRHPVRVTAGHAFSQALCAGRYLRCAPW